MLNKLRRKKIIYINAASGLFLFASYLSFAQEAAQVDKNSPVVVINRGIGGENSKKLVDRFDRDVMEAEADYAVIMVGTNDVANSHALISVDQYEANVDSMLKIAKAGGVKHIVLVTIPPVIESLVLQRHSNHPNQGKINELINEYNLTLVRLAQTYKADLVDLHQAVMQNGGTEATKTNWIRNPQNGGGADGIHFTPEGYRQLALLVADAFKSKIQPGERVVCIGDSLTFGYPVNGKGTVFGETYPSELNNTLNEMVGVPKDNRAYKPVRDSDSRPSLVPNGDFEDTDDGLTAIGWKLWQVPRRYEGTVNWLEANNSTGGFSETNAIEIRSDEVDIIAYLIGGSFDVSKQEKLKLKYKSGGNGEIRVLVTFYDAKRKPVKLEKNTAAFAKISEWNKVNDEAQTFEFSFERPAAAVRMSLGVQIKGVVKLDDVAVLPMDHAINQTITPIQVSATLKNRWIEALFLDVEHGAGLAGIRHPSGWNFIRPKSSLPLWQIKLRKIVPPGPLLDPDGSMQTVNLSLDPEQEDGSNTQASTVDGADVDWLVLDANNITYERAWHDPISPYEIEFNWVGIDLPGEPKSLDVKVSVTLSHGDRFLRFRTSIDNRSSILTAFYVMSPRVDRIYPENGRIQDDYLASPVYVGRLIHDPIKHGILNKPRRFQPNRSGHSMQFDAYYNQGNGLYMGCFDGEHNVKRYEMTSSESEGIGWAVVHVPDNMTKVPQIWETPYDTVLTSFEGDWYDASQIYREWALRQSWAARGPLHQQADLPKWFADIDTWLMINAAKMRSESIPEEILALLPNYSIGAWNTGWGKGHHFSAHSPDRFPLDKEDVDFQQTMNGMNIPVMSYIQAICWDVATDSFVTLNNYVHNVYDYYGRPVTWKVGETELSAIAWPGEVWQEVLGDTIAAMAKSGMRSAYLDSANHGGTYLNFNPTESMDSWGGGNQYVKSNHRLLDSIKARAREIDPGFCFTAESFWEGNMAQLDAYLTVNTTNQYLDGTQVTAIPLAQAVYHDHTIFYGHWVGRPDLEDKDGIAYFAKWGQSLVQGIKPGWDQISFLTRFENHELAAQEFGHRVRAYHAAKDFLLYGTLLRQPKVVGDLALIEEIPWHISWGERFHPVSLPRVVYEAWRSPDGRVMVAFYNISSEAQQITVDVSGIDFNDEIWSSSQIIYGPDSSASLSGKHLAVMIQPQRPLFVLLRDSTK